MSSPSRCFVPRIRVEITLLEGGRQSNRMSQNLIEKSSSKVIFHALAGLHLPSWLVRSQPPNVERSGILSSCGRRKVMICL